MEGNKKDPENMGITSRLVKDVFDRIDQADVALVFMVKVSYVEIYLEKVRDLLNSQNSNLRVRETKDRGGRCSDRGQQQQHRPTPHRTALVASSRVVTPLAVCIDGCTEASVTTPAEVQKILDQGSSKRAIASTRMNMDSRYSARPPLPNTR